MSDPVKRVGLTVSKSDIGLFWVQVNDAIAFMYEYGTPREAVQEFIERTSAAMHEINERERMKREQQEKERAEWDRRIEEKQKKKAKKLP